jgi:protein-S-isoprenylcysteine O-methyltransferase Ste14
LKYGIYGDTDQAAQEDNVNDAQFYLIAWCLFAICFYAAIVWIGYHITYFLAFVTVAISYGVLGVSPDGNVITVGSLALVTSIVLWRFSMIWLGSLPRMLWLARQEGNKMQMTWVEFAGLGEPIVQAGVAVTLLAIYSRESISEYSVTAPIGAIMALFYPRIMNIASRDSQNFATLGHVIRQDHKLMQHGIYGLIRHPMYVAAFWLWLALAVALWSKWVLVFWAGYALPALLLYAGAEERQAATAFGDQYKDYRHRVPGFIPQKPIALMRWILFSRNE